MIIIKDVQKIFLREPGIPVDECILADDRWEERMPHYMFCPYNGKSVLQDWSLFDKLTDMLFEITDGEGFIRDILLAMKKDVGYKKLINYIRTTPDITKEKSSGTRKPEKMVVRKTASRKESCFCYFVVIATGQWSLPSYCG